MSSYVRERILRREVGAHGRSSKPFGMSAGQIVAAILTLVFFGVVLSYYFTSLRPEQDRLARLEKLLDEQRAQIINQPRQTGDETLQRDTIQEALDSLEIFKSQHLKNRSQGIITLFKEINAIAGKNSVRLTSGINMREEKTGAETEQNASRSRSVESVLEQFRSVKIDFTVAGSYQNLRNFISDLERNKQFIVIDSIQLLNVEESAGGGVARRSQAAGVALSINLTAYFQD
jgi:hypothetical protein